MAKYILTHGHLVLDGQREYLDGAILFEDNKLLQVYPHSNKLTIEEDTTEINVKGQLVFPVSDNELGLKDCVIFNANGKDALKELIRLSKTDDYVLVRDDGDIEALLFTLKNISRKRVILNSDNYQITLKRLHDSGVGYSDLSLMICGNIARACGQEHIMVKGNPVNLAVVDKDFKTIFEVVDGEFIYD